MKGSHILIAHAGEGASWQAMLVVAGVVLTGFLLAAALGRIRIDQADDLVVPLASTALVSSLGTILSEWVSDGIGWGLPLLVVALVTMLLAAFTPLDVRFPSPLPMGATALALVSAIVLHQPLTIVLHPPLDPLPLRDDAAVRIVEPVDGAAVDAGPVQVVVEVAGGSIGPGGLPPDAIPDDPEEAGTLDVALREVHDDGSTGQQQLVDVTYDSACTIAEPCRRVDIEVDADPGTYELTVEFVRGDGTPLAPFVRDEVTFTIR